MSKSKSKTRGYEISDDLHTRMKVHATAKGLKLGEAATMAFESWLDGVTRMPPAPYLYDDSNKEAHELLEDILKRGGHKRREWITGNLVTFVEAIDPGPATPQIRPIRKQASK